MIEGHDNCEVPVLLECCQREVIIKLDTGAATVVTLAPRCSDNSAVISISAFTQRNDLDMRKLFNVHPLTRHHRSCGDGDAV
jgi:hypothetical protein